MSPLTGQSLLDDTGASILHVAAKSGLVAVIDAVLQVSRDMVRDENGWTPGMIAQRCGHEALAKRLTAYEERNDVQTVSKTPEMFSEKFKGEKLNVSLDGLEVSLPSE